MQRGQEKKPRRARVATALMRAGYALAGTLAAVLVAWAVATAYGQPYPGMLGHFARVAATGAVLMLWASLKPARCRGGSAALEALLVFAAVLAVRAGGDYLASPGMMEYYRSPLVWIGSYVVYLLNGCFGFVLPAAWVLGSGERWPRRALRWVIVELALALAVGALIALDLLGFLTTSLPAFLVYQALFVAGALAAGAVVQRLACEFVWRTRARRAEAPCP